MNDLSYVYHKTVEPAVKKYALCSNPRDGAVSRTYFPPSSYELSRQNDFIHRELSRRAGFQKRKARSVIDGGVQTEISNKSSKLPPIRLNERILDDYEPGKVFQESSTGASRRLSQPADTKKVSVPKLLVLKSPSNAADKFFQKSEMRLRFEAEEEYMDRVRLNKRLSNIMSHRVERFYYLQGGMASMSPKFPQPMKINTNQSMNSYLDSVKSHKHSVDSPIANVLQQNDQNNTPVPLEVEERHEDENILSALQNTSEDSGESALKNEEPGGTEPNMESITNADVRVVAVDDSTKETEDADGNEVN